MSNRMHEIERLVDGELSPEEHRRLVASLDEEPGGWRQCALAFLEAQALSQELGHVRRSLDNRGDKPTNHETEPREMRIWDNAQVVLAIAASFLVAFGLGLAAPKILSQWQEWSRGGNKYAVAAVGANENP